MKKKAELLLEKDIKKRALSLNLSIERVDAFRLVVIYGDLLYTCLPYQYACISTTCFTPLSHYPVIRHTALQPPPSLISVLGFRVAS